MSKSRPSQTNNHDSTLPATVDLPAMIALQQELHECQEELQLERSEREDFGSRWEQQRREMQDEIQELKGQLLQTQGTVVELEGHRRRTAEQDEEIGALKEEIEKYKMRERQLLEANTELQNSKTVLAATVNDLVSRLEEVVIEREMTAEEKRAVESKVVAVTKYAKQQTALASAFSNSTAKSGRKSKQPHLNMASMYF